MGVPPLYEIKLVYHKMEGEKIVGREKNGAAYAAPFSGLGFSPAAPAAVAAGFAALAVLGLVGGGGGGAALRPQDPQPGQPPAPDAPAGVRRVGARLLPALSEPAGRVL